MNIYNKYYKEKKALNPSGWKEEDLVKAAADSFAETEGKPFKWDHCVKVLQKMPKFKTTGGTRR